MTDAEAITEAIAIIEKRRDNSEDEFMYNHFTKIIQRLKKLLAAQTTP